MQLEALIDRLPLFAALPGEEIHHIAETVRQRDFEPGETLFSEGDKGDSFSIIIDGQLDIIKALGSPEERVLATLGAGEFIGEMSLLYPERQRSASARARTPIKLLEITQADFDSLLRRHPALAFHLMQEMSVRLRNSENATIRDLQEKNRELAEAYEELQRAQAQIIEKEKLEHELQVARKIQEGILPKTIPVIPGWAIAAYWQPAHAVSGDFYDFVVMAHGRLGFIVGDATGKGVPASLVMATTRSVMRAMAKQYPSPGELLYKVNNLLCQDMPANMFVTCLVAVLDPQTGYLRFANAGHDLPYQRTPVGVVDLRAYGMPLGLMPEMHYDEKEITLAPGDSLLLYSDGLVEAHSPTREMFGFPRLRSLLGEHPGGIGLTGYLLEKLAEFTGPDWEQEDDVTLVVVERQA